MEFLNEMQTAAFWVGLWQIVLVNIVLSGDNAVVIALAARSLPAHQQKKAILWGAGAAVGMRIVLTIIALEMLKWPWLKLVGAVLLLWIAVKLLVPEDGDKEEVESSSNLWAAVKTILIADLVMSLDNVIGVAAAAKGSIMLLTIGLALSIPLVVFGATILMKLMQRFPVIIVIGAGLLGWVAGEMAATDPVVHDWVEAHAAWLHWAAPAVGALFVVVLGKWLAARASAGEPMVDLADQGGARLASTGLMMKLLVPLDDSEPSRRAIETLTKQIGLYKDNVEIHLLNVQRPLPAHAASHFEGDVIPDFYREKGNADLAPARARLDEAKIPYRHHIGVGSAAEVITRFAKEHACAQIIMGTRGMGSVSNLMLGSVAAQVVHLSPVPVLLVK
jgi:YjbE family integral membrane protein